MHDLRVKLSDLFATWRCYFCGETFIDGDLHHSREGIGTGFSVAVAERWMDRGPVCEDCGVSRNIPKYV